MSWSNLYNSIAERLMKVSSDKYLHILCCLLICSLVGAIAGIWMSGIETASVGFVIAVLVGVAKELWDKKRGETFDLKDLTADVIGAGIGAILVMIL